jgi:hypothetical protein
MVSTEDMVELSLFDDVLTEKQHKHRTKIAAITDFMVYCKDEIAKKLKALDIKS